MSTTKKIFEKWNKRFERRKPRFEEAISSWKSRGKMTQAEHGRELLSTAAKLHQSILHAFEDTHADQEVLATDVKSFKKVVKELSEISKSQLRQWVEAIVVALVAVVIIRNFLFGLYHVPSGSAEPTLLVGDRVWGNKMAYLFGSKPQKNEQVMFDNPEFKFEKSNMIKYLWQKYVGFPIPVLGLPGGPDNWVKRVIAVPGDIIEGRIEDDKTVVYVNNEKLDEQYLNPYPLIGLRKSTGFIDAPILKRNLLLSWLAKQTRPVFYTYDPSKPFDEQPYYTMDIGEVLPDPRNPQSLDPWLKLSRDPAPGMYGGTVDVYGPMKVPEGKYWMMGDSRRNSKDSRVWGFLDEDLIHGRASFIIYSIDSEEPFWLLELLKHPIDFWTKKVRWSRFFKGIS